MSLYTVMLDALVRDLEADLSIPATRDPSAVPGLVASGSGCVFVGFPTVVGRLLGAVNLDVPVSLVAPAPSDLRAVDWLLDHIDALTEACASNASLSRPLDIGDLTYPAVTVTARIAL